MRGPATKAPFLANGCGIYQGNQDLVANLQPIPTPLSAAAGLRQDSLKSATKI